MLLQVRAYLHIDDSRYTVLTSASEGLTPLYLNDHWQELPHLNKLEEYFEQLTEQLSIPMPSKQLALTQADLVQHAAHSLCCLSCPGIGTQHLWSTCQPMNPLLRLADTLMNDHPFFCCITVAPMCTAENEYTLFCLAKCETAITHVWSICRACICPTALSFLYIISRSTVDGHAGEYCHLCGWAAGVQHSHAVPSSQRSLHLRQAGHVKR